MRINMGKKIPSDVEQTPNIVAAKGYNDTTGLVSISGWKGHASKETPILVTVVDQSSQVKWTRLIDYSASKRNTLKVKIPRSAVDHQIVATAELLRVDDSYATDANGPRHFTVESTSTCVATATQKDAGDGDLEHLMLISCSLSETKSTIDPPKKLSLQIDRPSTDVARLRLTKPSPGVSRWLITIVEEEAGDRKEVFLLPATEKITNLEFPIRDGREPYVEAIGLDRTRGNIICRGSTSCKIVEEVEASDLKNGIPLSIDEFTSYFKFAIHNGREFNLGVNNLCRNATNNETGRPTTSTQDELRQLHQIAVDNAGDQRAPCVWLYRNKSPEYFDDILKNHGGIMEPYLKDNSGDPRSPINGRIDGLFFMASVNERTGEPFRKSYFGPRRICIPSTRLQHCASNLYFADYYCMNKRGLHYVTLVMTKPNSKADEFCRGRLLQLDVHDPINNPFFFYSDVDQLRVAVSNDLRVEVLFTENVDISRYNLKKVKTKGKGSSTPGGKPKYSRCNKCNLH